LEKDPQKRLRHIGDVMALVDGAPAAETPAAGLVADERRSHRWQSLWWGLACVLAAAIAGLAGWLLKPAAPKPVTRFIISLPPGDHLDLSRRAIAISPDGTHVVYAAGRSSFTQLLYLRPVDGLEAQPIAGTEGAQTPFFSPDGRWLGFYADGRVKKISLTGGPPVSLADAVNAAGIFDASWSTEGTIAFTAPGVIHQVSDTGSNVRPLTRLEKGETGHSRPEYLPGGTNLLFNVETGTGAFSWVFAVL
jgi:eukaryotic-like serine/threonine-protein kinase